MKKIALALALAGAFASFNAQAWGYEGHRAVAAIAERLLKGTNAEKQIAALLKPGESLESISVWADCVKGSTCGPQTPEMQEYVAANARHGEYHYTDVPYQMEHYRDGAMGTSDVDIVVTLRQAIAVLQGKTDPASNPHGFTRRQALLVITHLVGDIHQPLHVGASYVDKSGKFVVPGSHAEVDNVNIFDPRGGNNLMIDDEKMSSTSASLIPGEAKPLPPGVTRSATRPLHSYWDSTVVDYAMRRSSTKTPEQFAQKMVESHPDIARSAGEPGTWPTQWADDSLAAARVAFTGVTAGKMSQQTSRKGEVYYTFAMDTPPNYPVPSSDLARTQLVKGGYRLAALLQAIWP
jgi:hypothetical protein